MAELYSEMDALETTEAKIYKALDNMEAVIQHNESDISTWSDNEFELNLTYGNDKVEFSPFLKKFREAIREETLHKINESAGEK